MTSGSLDEEGLRKTRAGPVCYQTPQIRQHLLPIYVLTDIGCVIGKFCEFYIIGLGFTSTDKLIKTIDRQFNKFTALYYFLSVLLKEQNIIIYNAFALGIVTHYFS